MFIKVSTRILTGLALILFSVSAQAYVINWQSAEMTDNPQPGGRTSTNVAFDDTFYDGFPSVTATQSQGYASASVSSTQNTTGATIFADTSVDWNDNMTWSGIWANANANMNGVFSIESALGLNTPILVDILISITGDYADSAFSLDGIDYQLDAAAPTTISLLMDVGRDYDIFGYLYSWTVGAQPSANTSGSVSANSAMNISLLMPSESASAVVPAPTTIALLMLGMVGMLIQKRQRITT